MLHLLRTFSIPIPPQEALLVWLQHLPASVPALSGTQSAVILATFLFPVVQTLCPQGIPGGCSFCLTCSPLLLALISQCLAPFPPLGGSSNVILPRGLCWSPVMSRLSPQQCVSLTSPLSIRHSPQMAVGLFAVCLPVYWVPRESSHRPLDPLPSTQEVSGKPATRPTRHCSQVFFSSLRVVWGLG